MTQHPRAQNSKAAQLAALIDVAREKGLTVTGLEIGPRLLRVLTAPLPESPVVEDAADRWLRENTGAGKAGRRA